MKALLRYALMKGMRESFVYPLLFGPAVFFSTPLITRGLYEVIRGRGTWPLSIAINLTPAGSVEILTPVALIFSAIIAGAGAFWIFRSEMTGRTIGFFVLARRPAIVAATATLFGAVAGVCAFAFAVGMLALLTGSVATRVVDYSAAMVIVAIASSALGTLAVAVSQDTSMLFPVFGMATVAGVSLADRPSVPLYVSVIAVAVIASVAAPFLWRRRCAA